MKFFKKKEKQQREHTELLQLEKHYAKGLTKADEQVKEEIRSNVGKSKLTVLLRK